MAKIHYEWRIRAVVDVKYGQHFYTAWIQDKEQAHSVAMALYEKFGDKNVVVYRRNAEPDGAKGIDDIEDLFDDA